MLGVILTQVPKRPASRLTHRQSNFDAGLLPAGDRSPKVTVLCVSFADDCPGAHEPMKGRRKTTP